MTRWLPLLWCAALTALLLGPALFAPGYVIGHDLVWVPRLDLRPGFLGLGSGLPRAVPSDAVVAVLDDLVPAAVLERLMLAGALLLAGTGAARLVGDLPEVGLVGRLAAVSAAVWSPFVVERLWLGHWPVVLAYGVIPWLVVAGRARRLPGWTWLLLLTGSLSANAGLMCALTLLLCGWRRGRRLALVAAVLAANAPWAVAGLRQAGQAADVAGYQVFALHGDAMPAPLAALSLAGVWNADVVPSSRDGVLAWVALAGLVVLAAAGLRRWWVAAGSRRLALLWAVGYAIAVTGWAAPDAIAWLGGHVPGVGLLRDSSRELPLCLPAYVGVVAAGAQRLAAQLPRIAVGVAAALLPVMVLPDASWGIGGALTPAHYPPEWAQARAIVRGHGDVLVLPLSNYRAPAWAPQPVLDPLPRFLAPDAVYEDTLVVDGVPIVGEDPRVRRAAAALAEPDPAARSAALAAEGIGWVAVERDAHGSAPAVAGEVVSDGPLLTVVRLASPARNEHTSVALLAAWAAYLLLAATAVMTPVVRMVTRRRAGATVRD